MAEYIVTRTSTWMDKPIEEAIPRMVHRRMALSGRASKTFMDEMRGRCMDVRESNDGGFSGYLKNPEEVWVCDIPDLHAFVERYGRIILEKPNNKEGLWEIEIYDDYRE